MHGITDKQLAAQVSKHFFALLFWAIGISSTLGFIVTAKWYMVGIAGMIIAGGWYVLYKFEENLWKYKNRTSINA